MIRVTFAALPSAALLLILPLSAQRKAALDAGAAAELAISRNREYLAVSERIHEAEGLLRQAGVRPYPTLDVEGASGRPLGTAGEEEYSAGYSLPFERGGKRSARIAVAREGLELARAELQERRRQLVFDVKSRYAEAVNAYRKAQAAQTLLRIEQRNYDLTNARVEAGDAAPVEAALFRAETNKARARQVIASGKLAGALSALQRAIGLDAADDLNIDYASANVSAPPPLEELRRRAMARPDLRSLRIAERQRESERSLAEAEGKPDVTASARYARRNAQFDALGISSSGSTVPLKDRDNVLSLGISIPLFGTERNRGNMEAAQARILAARQRRAFLESTIPQEVESAYRRLQAATDALRLLKDAVNESEANLRVIQEAYSLGQLRALDVLNEQRHLVEARQSEIDAELEAGQARNELEFATGAPLQ